MGNLHMELAALAVFKSLYDNDKNVYNIIWEFTKNSLAKRELNEFMVSDLRAFFTEDYGFDNIPVAVMTTMLRKHKREEIEQRDNKFYIMPKLKRELVQSAETVRREEQKTQFDQLIRDLATFIEVRFDKQYSTDVITTELRDFLLDEYTSGKLTNEINEYILEKQNQKEFLNVLNQIKEGFILYSGICWCGELNELGTWNTPLTLYFDMDIIFYLAGYSGQIYQTIIKELYDLVQEINVEATRKSGKRLISIKYFEEERDRIDHYFDIAESIVRSEKNLDPSEVAMLYIVSRCKTQSDVVRMRSDLDLLLRNMAIMEDTRLFYDGTENWVNNIESNDLINKYGTDMESSKRAERYIKRINYISLLRKGKESTSFNNCKYIMVTRNHLAAQLDRDADALITKKQYRRVISPEVLTSQFWFQMNKGFSRENTLTSIDVVAQAKIIMTRQINENIADCHHSIKRSFEQGDITEEQAVRQCAELRKYCVTPDNATKEILAETCVLSECSVEEMIQKQEEERIQHIETLREMEDLKRKHMELEQSVQNEHARAEAEAATALESAMHIDEQEEIIRKKEEELQTHEKILSDQESVIKDLQEQIRRRDEHDAEVDKRKRIRRRKIIIAIVILFFVIGVIVITWGYYCQSKIVMAMGCLVSFLDGSISVGKWVKGKM